MKWHITEDEMKKTQLEDETEFKKFFSHRGFKTVKIAENPDTKTPDYELSNFGKTVICEIKSRFGNDEYNRIVTAITGKLSKLKYGYNYDFAHFFEKMPSQTDIGAIIRQVDQEIGALPKQLRFPYTLRLGYFDIQNTYEDIIKMQPENRDFLEREMEEVYSGTGNHQVIITLAEKNAKNKLICAMVSGGSSSYPGTRDKGYFKSVFKAAKKQLKNYIDDNIVGIIFYNHSNFAWRDNDIISLFGDLHFRFRPDLREYSIALGANRILSDVSKTWLSFLGFFNGPDNNYTLTIYRNGFALKELPIAFFTAKDCAVKTIKLSEDGKQLLIING